MGRHAGKPVEAQFRTGYRSVGKGFAPAAGMGSLREYGRKRRFDRTPAAAWRKGRRMDPEQAVAYAVRERITERK